MNYGGSNPAARKAPDCTPHPGEETQHWLLRPLWDFPSVFAPRRWGHRSLSTEAGRSQVLQVESSQICAFVFFNVCLFSPVKAGRSLIAKLRAAVDLGQAVCFHSALNAGLMAVGCSPSTISLRLPCLQRSDASPRHSCVGPQTPSFDFNRLKSIKLTSDLLLCAYRLPSTSLRTEPNDYVHSVAP